MQSEHTEKLAEVLDDWLTRQQQGEAVNVAQLVSQYPELADRLPGYVQSLEAFGAAFGPVDSGDSAASCDSSETVEPQQATGTTARQLGRYQLIRELGRGGMGVVYEAREIPLDRRVALKILPLSATLDPRQLKRFEIEARAAAGLDHPNIIPVYAAGEYGGVHFIAMQCIDGCTLAQITNVWQQERGFTESKTGFHLPETAELQRCKAAVQGEKFQPSWRSNQTTSAESDGMSVPEVPTTHDLNTDPAKTTERIDAATELPVQAVGDLRLNPAAPWGSSATGDTRHRWVADWIAKVADALHCAHEHGIIHRDVKPSNILLDLSGNPFVADFGLARVEADVTLTRSGDRMGTLAYMSPEQAEGPADRVDRRSDVYSLGVTLYELLALRRPFNTEQLSKSGIAFSRAVPTRLRRIDRKIASDLELIVMQAIAAEPELRYQSCDAMAEDLRSFLQGLPIAARRPSVLHRGSRWLTRHRIAVLTAFLLLTFLAVTSTVAAFLIEQQRRRAIAGESAAVAWANREREARKTSDRLLARAEFAEQLANERLWKALRSQTQMLLRSGQQGQGFETLETLRQTVALRGAGGLLPDEIVALRSDAIAALAKFDVRESWTMKHPSDSATIETTAFAPNFLNYAIHDGPTIAVRRTGDHQLVAKLELDSFPLVCRFSDDSQCLAIVSESDSGERLDLWDWRASRKIMSLGAEELGSPIARYSVAFDPTNERFAAGLLDGTVIQANRKTGEIESQLSASSPVHNLAYSPEGTYLLGTASEAKELIVWRLMDDEQLVTRRFDDPVYGTAWSTNGHWIGVGVGFDTHLFGIDNLNTASLVNLEDTQPLIYSGHAAPVHELRFAPDSKLMVSWGYDGQSRFWHAGSDRLLLAVSGHAGQFDPKSKNLSFRGVDEYGVWEIAANNILTTSRMLGTKEFHVGQLQWLGENEPIVAGGAGGSIHFWTADGKKWLAQHVTEDFASMAPHPGSHDLLVCDAGKLYQLKIRLSGDKKGRRIKSIRAIPVPLPDDRKAEHVAATARTDGVIAVGSSDRPSILLLNADFQVEQQITTDTPPEFLWLDDVGEYLAFGPRHAPPLNIYDIKQERLVALLRAHSTAEFAGSATDNLLISGTSRAYHVWNTTTWDLQYQLPRTGALHPAAIVIPRKGKGAFAVDTGSSLSHFELETGQIRARFPAVKSGAVVWDLEFGPAEEFLAMSCGQDGLAVWNIKSLRSKLKELQLDWDD